MRFWNALVCTTCGVPVRAHGLTFDEAWNYVALRIIHNEPPLQQSASYQEWSKKSTQEIIDSLAPGAKDPLQIKADGAVVQGNSRILVLMERGIDVNNPAILPRTLYKPIELPDFSVE